MGQGERFNLIVDKFLDKGDELILPEKTRWYVLDDNPGEEKIIVNSQNKESIFRIKHLDQMNENKLLKEKIFNDKLNSGNKKKKINKTENFILSEINQKKDAGNEINTRGVGSWIYKEFSDAVVYIMIWDEIKNERESSGTGFILSDASILTNWHVVGNHKKPYIFF